MRFVCDLKRGKGGKGDLSLRQHPFLKNLDRMTSQADFRGNQGPDQAQIMMVPGIIHGAVFRSLVFQFVENLGPPKIRGLASQ
jgi:hypothetical protein